MSARPFVASVEYAKTTGTKATVKPKPTPFVEIEDIYFDEELDEELYTVGVGRNVNIPFVLYPENASCANLEASVDNTEIATVSLENKDECIVQIVGVSPGEVTLTLTSGEKLTATKSITVEEVLPEEITIVAEPQSPLIGDAGLFTVKFEPLDVTNGDVTWQSDAPKVIKVHKDGSYEALSVGEATITAKHKNGVVGSIHIEVLPIEVEAIELSTKWDESKPFCRKDSMQLVAEVTPGKATDKSLTWFSGDEAVATVSDKGVVKAVFPGTTVITAKAANGKTGTYKVAVDVSPQKFRVSASISMKSNDHVGNSWSTGFEYNGETIASGSTVSIMPNDSFSVCGWAKDNDANPDYGSYSECLTLTNEMCESGFKIEGDANVRENGGRYRGHYAVWRVKITFTPAN